MTIYNGHVDPGGPAISRLVTAHDAAVEVRKFSVGPMDNNAYLLRDTAGGEALLIDAANDAERILREIGDTTLVGIITTHGHGDHWQALDEVADATEAPVWLHPDDQPTVPRQADHAAADGDVVIFGSAAVRLIHTPGHTPGSTCILLGEKDLFTGDTLFPGGPGRTTTPEEFAQVMDSVERRLFDSLPDETWVYPGHGDDTTISAERPSIPEWRARGW
ncbi:MAG: MBL fold metallo-hydrolase [Nitriliruptorales bacterium]|nr:MBL fold metallo-hydrolase [Nitriliruptorales bacterium]